MEGGDLLGFTFVSALEDCAEKSLRGLPESSVSFVFLRRTDPQPLDAVIPAETLSSADLESAGARSSVGAPESDSWQQLMAGDDEDALMLD